MISLRKAMDAHYETVLQTMLECFRKTLRAVGDAGGRACPPHADHLKAGLRDIQDRLTADTPEMVSESATQLEAELRTWGDLAAGYYDQKTEELREILLIVATATSDLASRDERYTKQIQGFTDRLRSATRLNDLTAIRQSLTASVAEINSYVAQMNKDGQDSFARMRAQLATYESRLAEVERIASIDPLTGLANRRALETQLQHRVDENRPFSVIFWDLNGFKSINDRYGHSAGDDLLQQVASELIAFRANEVVGRWGGDEFIVIVDGDQSAAERFVGRVEQWVAGSYTLNTAGSTQKVSVTLATGVASWRPGESVTDVLHRADAAMYTHKATMKASLAGRSR